MSSLASELLHLPDEPAGVEKILALVAFSLRTFSPARQDGRGLCFCLLCQVVPLRSGERGYKLLYQRRQPEQQLWPPKPKLLEMAKRTRISRASSARSPGRSGIGVVEIDRRMNHAVLMVRTVAMISTPPEAPSRWPIMLLVLLMASLRAWSPKTCLIAFVSASSPSSVLVPWALMYWMSSGLRRASLRRQLHGVGGPDALGVRSGDVVAHRRCCRTPSNSA